MKEKNLITEPPTTALTPPKNTCGRGRREERGGKGGKAWHHHHHHSINHTARTKAMSAPSPAASPGALCHYHSSLLKPS